MYALPEGKGEARQLTKQKRMVAWTRVVALEMWGRGTVHRIFPRIEYVG